MVKTPGKRLKSVPGPNALLAWNLVLDELNGVGGTWRE